MLGFHIQRFQLLWCHNILQYLRKQLSPIANVHIFLVGPWHFVITYLMIFAGFFNLNTLFDSIFHDNGILLYLLQFVESFNNIIKYCTIFLSFIIHVN
jgi:hypothetical protein